MTRVAAPNARRAREAAVFWFTQDPQGELDFINGPVTVLDVTGSPYKAHWIVESNYARGLTYRIGRAIVCRIAQWGRAFR